MKALPLALASAALALLLAGCECCKDQPAKAATPTTTTSAPPAAAPAKPSADKRGCCDTKAMHTMDVGTCMGCNSHTWTGAHKLCDTCAAKAPERCTHCMKELKGH